MATHSISEERYVGQYETGAKMCGQPNSTMLEQCLDMVSVVWLVPMHVSVCKQMSHCEDLVGVGSSTQAFRVPMFGSDVSSGTSSSVETHGLTCRGEKHMFASSTMERLNALFNLCHRLTATSRNVAIRLRRGGNTTLQKCVVGKVGEDGGDVACHVRIFRVLRKTRCTRAV